MNNAVMAIAIFEGDVTVLMRSSTSRPTRCFLLSCPASKKWEPAFPRRQTQDAFARRSCSSNGLERDDDSKIKSSHPGHSYDRARDPTSTRPPAITSDP